MNQRKIFTALWIILGFGVMLTLFLLVVFSGTSVQMPQGMEGVEQESTLPPPPENIYTPKDFGYVGDYLTCLTDESIMGIDVSSYQKQIDWEAVKQAGVEFVMIRLGYRGYGEGQLKADKFAQENYQGAKAAGLKIGAYFFSQAITVEEAEEEAHYAMELAEGWELDMPLVYDWECLADDYRTVGVNARMLTDCTKAFCDTVEAEGYPSMVYFNPNQSRKQMYLAELTQYGFWLAMYSDQMNYPYRVDMWQYTNEGKVPGINGKVDINLYFPGQKGT